MAPTERMKAIQDLSVGERFLLLSMLDFVIARQEGGDEDPDKDPGMASGSR